MIYVCTSSFIWTLWSQSIPTSQICLVFASVLTQSNDLCLHFFLYLNLVVTVNTSITNLLSLCFSFDSIKWSMSVLLPVHKVFLYILKITILYKSFAILIAFIRPLPRVYSYVAYKLTILQDHITTLRALIWSFTGVCSHMSQKITACCKTFVTLMALVCFLFSMYTFMVYETLFCKKILSHTLHW